MKHPSNPVKSKIFHKTASDGSPSRFRSIFCFRKFGTEAPQCGASLERCSIFSNLRKWCKSSKFASCPIANPRLSRFSCKPGWAWKPATAVTIGTCHLCPSYACVSLQPQTLSATVQTPNLVLGGSRRLLNCRFRLLVLNRLESPLVEIHSAASILLLNASGWLWDTLSFCFRLHLAALVPASKQRHTV